MLRARCRNTRVRMGSRTRRGERERLTKSDHWGVAPTRGCEPAAAAVEVAAKDIVRGTMLMDRVRQEDGLVLVEVQEADQGKSREQHRLVVGTEAGRNLD